MCVVAVREIRIECMYPFFFTQGGYIYKTYYVQHSKPRRLLFSLFYLSHHPSHLQHHFSNFRLFFLLTILPPITLRMHRSRHFREPSNIAPGHQTRELALRRLDVLLRRLETVLEARFHDALELCVHLFGRPGYALGVLGHFEAGDGDAAGVGGFACDGERGLGSATVFDEGVQSRRTWSVPNGLAFLLFSVLFKDANGLLRATHVASLGDEFGPGVDQRLSLLARHLILRRAWQGHVNLFHVFPWPCTLDVFDFALVAIRIGHFCQLLSLDFQIGNIGDFVGTDTLVAFGNDGAFAIREGYYCGAKFDGFEGRVLGDVSGTGYGDAFAFESLFSAGRVLDHVVDVL